MPSYGLLRSGMTAPAEALPRPRLHEVMDQADHVWIAGPAGAGKTLLVDSYVRARQTPVTRVNLVDGPDLCVHLFEFLRAEPAPYLGLSGVLPAWDPLRQGDLSAFADDFFERLFTPAAGSDELVERLTLVLEDLHAIEENEDGIRVIAALIKWAPRNVKLIMTSRFPPVGPLMTSRARRRNGIYINSDALLLTDEEVLALCRYTLNTGLGIMPAEDACLAMADSVGRLPLFVALNLEVYKATQSFPSRSESVYEQLDDTFWNTYLPRTRRTLCQLSCLGEIAAEEIEEIEELVGDAGAGPLLRGLCQSHHLVTALRSNAADGAVAYGFHDLLREYLQDKLATTFAPEERRQMWAQAAELHSRHRRIRLAVDCYLEAEAFDEAVDAIRQLRTHERPGFWRQSLALWLNKLRAKPGVVARHGDWIAYWNAEVRAQKNGAEARDYYRSAADAFRRNASLEGRCLAWCGLVRNIVLDWANFSQLEQLAAEGQELMADPGFAGQSAHIRIMMEFCRFDALLFSNPYQNQVAEQARIARELIEVIPEPDDRIYLGHNLYLYYAVVQGDGDAVRSLLAAMVDPTQKDRLDVVARVLLETNIAQLHWSTGQTLEAERAACRGRELCRRHGLTVLEFLLIAQSAYAFLTGGYPVLAEYEVARLRRATPPTSEGHNGHWLYLSTFSAVLRNKVPEAMEHADQAERNAVQFGGEMQRVLVRLSRAYALLTGVHTGAGSPGDLDTVETLLDELRAAVGSGPGALQRRDVQLVQCYFELLHGRNEKAAALLTEIFARGDPDILREHMLGTFSVPGIIAAVCGVEGLSPAMRLAMDDVIRRRKLWRSPVTPLRVSAFGRFEIWVGDELVASGKSRNIPERLFQVVLAPLPANCTVTGTCHIFDWMLPQRSSSADKALQNLHTNINSLNRLLKGEKKGVSVSANRSDSVLPVKVSREDNTITLNPMLCETDVLLFWDACQMCMDLLDMGRRDDPSFFVALVDQATRHYDGPFLASEYPDVSDGVTANMDPKTHEGCIRLARARYRDHLARCVKAILRESPVAQYSAIAKHVQEKLLEVDPALAAMIRLSCPARDAEPDNLHDSARGG